MTDKTLAEIIERVSKMKRQINDDWKCKFCGYEGGECECIGYNKAIDDVLSYLNSLKKETRC